MLSEQDSEMQKMLNDKNVTIVPDGIGVVKAAKMININIKERIAGIDIAKFLLEYANEKKLRVYFDDEKVIITVSSPSNLDVEIHQAMRGREFFKEIYHRDLFIEKERWQN